MFSAATFYTVRQIDLSGNAEAVGLEGGMDTQWVSGSEASGGPREKDVQAVGPGKRVGPAVPLGEGWEMEHG